MFDLPKYGAGICLARLSELLEAFEIDRIWLSRISVVVTGSNGKGSTAAFCDAIARARELRTGLFTSPHLFRFNERIQINGEPIGDDDWRRHHDEVMAAIEPISRRRGEGFGSFEAMFALACLHFKKQACDFAVLTGLRLRGVRSRDRRPVRSDTAGRLIDHNGDLSRS